MDLTDVGGEIRYNEITKKVTIHYTHNIIVHINAERPSTPIIGRDIVIDEEEDIQPSQNN